VLDGLVVLGTALIAGGGLSTAARLDLSMTALQFAIGALNDLVDAPADRYHVPPKPIPAGLVTEREARAVAIAAAGAGAILAVPDGWSVVALALLVLAVGAAYDVFAKGTPGSWIPFAVGIPILPIYGWVGATGMLHPAFAALVPMAVLAGAALAIANARADLDTDRAAGTRSVATALGASWSGWLDLALMTAATAIGVVTARASDWPPAASLTVLIGTATVAVALVLAGRDSRRGRAAWHLQAIGTGIAGLGWAAALLV